METNMKSLSRVNMAAVTRLTREGRLDEAMHLLRGGLDDAAGAASPGSARTAGDEASIIDMEPPSTTNGGAWTVPSSASPTPAPRPPSSRSTLRATLDRASKPRVRVGGMAAQMADALPPDARFEERMHASTLGQRSYKLYVPASHDGTPRALLVMLHGCTQSPDDFARGTRMNALAEEHGFVVAYPAQSQSANASRCWNWFNESDQQRDGGEPALIAGLTRDIMRELAIDPRRVHVAGLSAGGAMAAILGAAYPDLYSAVGVHSGLAPRAAHDMPSAFAAMRGGGVRDVASSRHVPTIVFHGDADATVHPLNGDQVIAHARGAAPLHRRSEAGTSAEGVAYTRSIESSADGRPRLEHWLLHGAGHAWSGGDPSGSFVAPRGPDASREMLRFFAEQA
jgi:poly(hydroxyalkanoate) depolymerase family esterase